MNYRRVLSSLYGAALLPAVLFVAGVNPARGIGRAVIKPGEVLIVVQPGTQKADLDALAAKVKATQVEFLGIPGCYRLFLPADQQTDAATQNNVAILKTDPLVRWANTNEVVKPRQTPTSTPNDPLFVNGMQWAPKIINLPQAWPLLRTNITLNVADIDTDYGPDHEDLKGRYAPGGMNFDATPADTNITATAAMSHGTRTSSIMVANTNNNIGMAGVCLSNINCVALKGLGSEAAILKAYAYLLADRQGTNTLKVGTVNMSFGFLRDPTNTSDPEYIAVKALDDAGILCIGAGAEGSDPTAPQAGNIPNAYPFVINVVAGNRLGKVAAYNRFGADMTGFTPRVDLVAPGGEGTGMAIDPDSIVAADDDKNGYDYEDGTSFAAPYVTGVAGLLFSVPNVTKAQVRSALLLGANHNGIATVPDAQYGYGYLDAYGSLSRVSVSAIITSPQGFNAQGLSSDPTNILPPPVETFKPTISMHLSNVTPDNVIITIDAGIPSLAKSFTLASLIAGVLPAGIPEVPIVQGTVTGMNPMYDISFPIVFPTTGFFQHTVSVTGTDPNTGLTSTDTRIFTITPHTIQAGLSMISIPYYEHPRYAPAPYTGTFRDVPQLLGATATLYRYLVPAELGTQSGAVAGAYAKYSATDPAANANASLRPPDELAIALPPTTTIAAPLANISDTRPLGIGYFINTSVAIPVITYGNALTDRAFSIPLHEGWNLVGDPYPFAVPFNSTEIERAGARVPIGQAVDQKLILPYLFRLVSGDYQFDTLPNGALQPWEGHWVYVVPKDPSNVSPADVVNLIVTPTPITTLTGRAAAGAAPATRSAGVGGWKLRLQAHSADQHDSNNFIGMSSLATDGNDLTKVPKPPKLNGGISLGIVRPNSPAGLYAQDLRSLGGTKQWNIVVSTDKPNTNVTLDWPDTHTLPRTYRVTLTDTVTGRSVDLRNSSSYQFTSGANAEARSFSVVASPTTAISGHAIISNVIVNQSRGRGTDANAMDIGYTVAGDVEVSVSVLGFGGQEIARVGATRAVGSGANHVNWNGRDAGGHPLPSGTYVLRIQATTSDGQKTQYVTPLLLTGR